MGWGNVAQCSRWGGAMWLSAADGVGQCGLVQPIGWGNVA